MIHPFAWLTWLVAATVALSATRNPLYLILIGQSIAIVNAVSITQRRQPLPFWQPSSLVVLFVVSSALFNALTVRYGNTVLVRLPAWLPLLGGPITLEALVYGALNGLALSYIFIAFSIVQRMLPISTLIGIIPRAFYPLAIVTAIAITFVPTTLRQAQHIREAQAIRGHRIQHLRDWLPILMPLLIGGLERAFQLAESLASRGFAAQAIQNTQQHRTTQIVVTIALTGLLGGWMLLLIWGYDLLGSLLMFSSAVLLIGKLRMLGKHAPHTRYRHFTWNSADTAVVLTASTTIALLLLPWPAIERATLGYYPYPLVTQPRFDLGIGFAIVGLVWPAITQYIKS
jgi:energy-coupling factor transport system permease protein